MTTDETVDEFRGAHAVRTSAEQGIIDAVTVSANLHGLDFESPPEERFIDVLPDARRQICHRLVRGLLRGRPDGVPSFALLSSANPTLPGDAHTALQATGAETLLRRTRPLPESCRFVAFVPFPASETILAAPITAIYGYDRFQLVGQITLLAAEGAVRDPHPVDVVSLLEREGAFPSDEQAERIREEVAESTANLAFAQLPSAPIAVSDSRSDSATVFDAQEGLPGADPASALERLAINGHPFHPCAKIRRGMTPAESLLYAPEFTDKIAVRFVAVERTYALEVQTDVTLTDLLYDHFPGLEPAVKRAIPIDRSHDEYAVIPIHPWQYDRVISDRYAAQIARGRVVPLPEYTWPATPLLNLRTVVPYAADSRSDPPPHLKLAVDVQLTNVVRTVSPQAVSNGPRVSELLQTVLERESVETLGILPELAATCYHAPDGPHPDGEGFDDARNLSGLVRASPYSHPVVPDDAIPVAVGSLLATSPVTERPVICDVLDRFADSGAATDAAVTNAFFESYVDAVVPEQLRLLSKYGIALESHPQNSYIVLDDGRPAAALVRDLGGIRVLGDRLARYGLSFDAYPDSDLDATGPRDLYNKLYYALFQNQFAEVIVTLDEHTALDESSCWDSLRTRCLETFEALRSDPDVPDEWIDRDEHALFEDPVIHKALTAMRLQGKRHEYVTSRVSNPLSC